MSKILILEENNFSVNFYKISSKVDFPKWNLRQSSTMKNGWLKCIISSLRKKEQRVATIFITDENTMSSIKGWLGCSY